MMRGIRLYLDHRWSCAGWWMLILLAFGAAEGAAQSLNEAELKANYLLAFVDYLQWDREHREVIVIGLLAAQPLESEIARHAALKSRGESQRDYEVKVMESVEEVDTVDVLFIGGGLADSWESWLQAAKRAGVLTVGEKEGFLEAGGLIEFVVHRNRLRFSLNLEASESHGIDFSSKLARIALNGS
jgi:hypothetical protein